MKRVFAPITVLVLSVGALFAQSEAKEYRFEVGVDKGSVTVLSGPEIENPTNRVAHVGFSPTRNFQLTFNYTKWEGQLSKNDVLNPIFAAKVNAGHSAGTRINFRDAVFDKRDIEMTIYELGLVKTIPLGGKHWESFIGISIGTMNSKAQVDWVGATKRNQDGLPVPAKPRPTFNGKDDNAFTTSVRGGLRYAFVGWFALQASLKISPIGSTFSEDINMMEANLGAVFRFGKF